MPTSTRKHRVIQYAVVNGKRDHLNFGLTEGRDHIRSARRYADTFHPYEFIARDGTAMHVAYARFLPGSPKHGYGKYNLDVTYMFELTGEAVVASFGLAPTS
jgi:hypothetical protein